MLNDIFAVCIALAVAGTLATILGAPEIVAKARKRLGV